MVAAYCSRFRNLVEALNTGLKPFRNHRVIRINEGHKLAVRRMCTSVSSGSCPLATLVKYPESIAFANIST
jgi:hypothetical protein